MKTKFRPFHTYLFWMSSLYFFCGCGTNKEDSVQWNADTPQNNEPASDDSASEDPILDTAIEISTNCNEELEIHIPSWTSPPAFGNRVHNQMSISNPCPFPVVLLGSPQNWFTTTNFVVAEIPPNHIEANSTIAVNIRYVPEQSGHFESIIHIPTDYREIQAQTEIDVLDPLELVVVGDGGLRVHIKNYGVTPEDIDIQYENLLSSTHDFRDVCFGNNRFVAVGGDLSGTENAHLEVQSKQFGQDWNDHSKNDNPMIACTYGDSFFVGISEHEQTPVHSLAGVQWQDGTKTPWMQDALHDIAFGQDLFIAVGDQGRISKSIDGTEWFSDISLGNLDLYTIIYAQNMFVIVGEFGLVLSSEDGIHWNEQVVGDNNISHIVYGNDQFLLSNGMNWYRSDDALLWEKIAENDIKLLTQIGSLVFGYKGQDIYKCSGDSFENCEMITAIPSGLQIGSGIFGVRP